MSHLSNLSLVVLTYNRPLYAIRQMRFWTGTPVNLFILDGSEFAINDNDLAQLKLSNNIYYHHWPYPIEERVKQIIPLISTSYVVLLGDDDFFIPSSLIACINELEGNKDMVACMGRTLVFSIDSMGITGKPFYSEMKNYKIDENNASDRMIEHMKNYTCSTIYAVHKAEIWKNCMTIFSSGNNKYSSSYPLELEFEMASAYFGKSKVINNLMWLRSKENPPVNTTDHNRKLPFEEWIHDQKYGAEVELFYTTLTTHLSQFDNSDPAMLRNNLEIAVGEYVNWVTLKGQIPVRNNSSDTLITKIKKQIPKQVKDSLKSIFKQPMHKPLRKTLLESTNDLEIDGNIVDIHEMEKINSLLQNFHSEKS